MKTTLQIYNKFNATVFDLISGDTEVKQTIALAYLLSHCDDTLKSFLALPAIRNLIGKINIRQYSDIHISAELPSHTRKRADVVLQFYNDGDAEFTLIVEAKSIKADISPMAVQKQLTDYLELQNFQLHSPKKFGCILTKNTLAINTGSICSVSWKDVLTILKDGSPLAKDYLSFLTNIEGTMKFYEAEVYSIPAGKTSYKYLSDDILMYECPNNGKYKMKKKPLYVTFRKSGGGEMEKLFGLEEVIILNPAKELENFLMSDYDADIRKRVQMYCESLWENVDYPNEEKQFFILSRDNQIELKHRPRPSQRNNAYRVYYNLADILSGAAHIDKAC